MGLQVFQGEGDNATEIERDRDDGKHYVYINELPGSATDATEGRMVEVRLSEELAQRVGRSTTTLPTPVALPPSLGDGEHPVTVFVPGGRSRWYLRVHENNVYSSFQRGEDDTVIRFDHSHKAAVRQTAEPRYGSIRHLSIYRGDGVETAQEEAPEEESAEEEQQPSPEEVSAERRRDGEPENIQPPAEAELEPSDIAADRRRAIMQFKFRTSTCGGDRYDVEFRLGWEGSSDRVTETVTIVVRKRITYHYVEVGSDPSSSAAHYSLERGSRTNTLQSAKELLLRDYGIELVPHASGTRQGPHRALLTGAAPGPNHSLRGYLINHAGLPASAPPARELWIVAGPRLKINMGDADEMGGVAQRHVAAVNCHMYENMEGSSSEIANQVLAVLLHEIGHNFGLVPSNQQAGGRAVRGGWREHGPHCGIGACIMYYRTESVSSLLQAFRDDANFCGRRVEEESFQFIGRCAIYLKTCDIRSIPAVFP